MFNTQFHTRKSFSQKLISLLLVASLAPTLSACTSVMSPTDGSYVGFVADYTPFDMGDDDSFFADTPPAKPAYKMSQNLPQPVQKMASEQQTQISQLVPTSTVTPMSMTTQQPSQKEPVLKTASLKAASLPAELVTPENPIIHTSKQPVEAQSVAAAKSPIIKAQNDGLRPEDKTLQNQPEITAPPSLGGRLQMTIVPTTIGTADPAQ